MNTESEKQKNLVDATDCLEAIGVFKAWKNVFFVITFLAFLSIQLSFWALDLGIAGEPKPDDILQAEETAEQLSQEESISENIAQVTTEIEQAATEVTADVNKPAEKPARKTIDFSKLLKPVHINWIIHTSDFVILISAMLYCLSILFCLKISLIGRLGGINHISRAFFISLVLLVFLPPWQNLFNGFLAGAVYGPNELTAALDNYSDFSIVEQVWYYIRFVGYWIIVLLLLICAHIRTGRWARATLRRLEVI